MITAMAAAGAGWDIPSGPRPARPALGPDYLRFTRIVPGGTTWPGATVEFAT